MEIFHHMCKKWVPLFLVLRIYAYEIFIATMPPHSIFYFPLNTGLRPVECRYKLNGNSLNLNAKDPYTAYSGHIYFYIRH